MSAHPPQHPPHPSDPVPRAERPDRRGRGGRDPPVPLTVWRTAHTDTDAPGRIPARLAARLVAAYSRPGENVVDLTDGHALAAACHAGARRHHPGWFTD